MAQFRIDTETKTIAPLTRRTFGEIGFTERCDLQEWIAKQPWSDGKVAMIGGSYEGTTAWATAVMQPPHLTTIVPEAAITYDGQKNAFVNVVSAGSKTGRQKLPVKIGIGNGTKIEILDGLKPGDKIILPS